MAAVTTAEAASPEWAMPPAPSSLRSKLGQKAKCEPKFQFHWERGPGQWAKAKLVRYADDFVILARYIDQRTGNWVAHTLEEWMGLTLNREKTRVVNLQETDKKA